MVCELGMSEKLGPLTFGKKEEMVFLGREIASHKDYSDETAQQIDVEVRLLVEGAYNKALDLLRGSLDKLRLLAQTLLEREVLDGDEMDRVLKGEKLPPIKPAEPTGSERPPAPIVGPPDVKPEVIGPLSPPEPRPAGA
jgi:cell division protease FtsH